MVLANVLRVERDDFLLKLPDPEALAHGKPDEAEDEEKTDEAADAESDA